MRPSSFLQLGLLFVTALPASDFPGTSDHPLVKRVTGSEIFFSKTPTSTLTSSPSAS